MRLISETDVRNLITIDDALIAVEASFLEQSQGTGINMPRQRIRNAAGVLHLMGAALTQRGYWGYKSYTTTKDGARFSINLYSLEDGQLLAIIEANWLGQMRTGAASGIATKYLARRDSKVMALFGSGYQAASQILAINAAFPLQDIKVFSRSQAKREEFAHSLGKQVTARVSAVDSPEEALEHADIITTITSSKDPVFPGAILPPGVHLNAAGSNSVIRIELDSTAIEKINLFFTDDLEQARIESGNLIHAYERNKFNWSQLKLFSEVVSSHHPGRQRDDEITLFESHGIALWDIALAAEVYERAIRVGSGMDIPFLN
jgi:alanine dehydrogenase